MIQAVATIGVTLFTVTILAALFWGYRRRREEKRRRKHGVVTIPVDAGYMVTAGCLGVLGYLGLIFILATLTFDLVDQNESGPEWLAWVVAIGLLVGFFAMVGWAVFGIGSSFAMTRLVVDRKAIRLYRRRRLKSVIFWDSPWKLERLARLRRVGYTALASDTGYSLLMRLRQRKNDLVLVFDVPGREVGGLPTYEGPQAGYNITDKAEWLQSEISFRHERWAEAAARKPPAVEVTPDALSARPPDGALKEALNFDEEELARNREGLSSDAQSGSIRGDQKLTLATYLVLGAAFGAGALYVLSRLLQGGDFGAFGPWLIVLLLACGFCLFMTLITRQSLRSEILVERLSGPFRLQHYRQSNEYWLRIGDEAFHVTKQLHDALENEALYNLYVARYGVGAQDTKLLSVEALEPPRMR